jgi:hypothetical protein
MPIIEKIAEAMISVVPSVKIPSPLGVRMLEQHLRKNQIRLIDLFVMVDRDKNWRLKVHMLYLTFHQQIINVEN